MQYDNKSRTELNPNINECSEPEHLRVEVFYRGKSYATKAPSLPFHIGRDSASCHLVVNNQTASRNHCSFVIKDNQIGIEDTSTNGTAVKLGRADNILLCKKFLPLSGQGYIKLGEGINLNDPDLIMFKIARCE